MDRSGLHLTVAAIVHFQNQFLFVEERDKISGKLVYNQPAGHVEAKEDLFAAVCRELYEETGLSLTPTAWLGISQLHAANGEFYFRVNVFSELTFDNSLRKLPTSGMPVAGKSCYNPRSIFCLKCK
jgi:phosphatase NudJ